MNTQKLPLATVAGSIVVLLSTVTFFVLMYQGSHRHVFAIAAGIAWLAGIIAVRPLVDRRSMSAFWFAFALLGFFLFFVDETYEYEGRVRLFPLLVGYMGIILCVLDVLSLTNGRAGAFVTGMFGRAFDPKNLEGRTLARELIVLVCMCGIVVAIYLFGFLVATPLVVMLWMRIAGGKSIAVTAGTGAGAFLFVWGLFELILRYELYRGWLWELIKG